MDDVHSAEVVLPCAELSGTLAFFTDVLRFRVDAIRPAEDPAEAVVSGHGLRIRLRRGAAGAPGVLRLLCRDPATFARGATELRAPNGTLIELAPSDPPLPLPPLRPSFVLRRMNDAAWVTGRAGMRYRDLIPDRQGGLFIASHIQIEEGGPVPDYVHFHRVRFQMIYCARGWVRLVYEDQGPPFVLVVGDCVLQPPGIRHKVLESSPGLEVIEVGSPAEHETLVDHELSLPTPTSRADRQFCGQSFVRHEARAATWRPREDGFDVRDLGIAAATTGLARAEVVRRGLGRPGPRACAHDAELLFRFVLDGEATLRRDGGEPEALSRGDAYVVPAGVRHEIGDCSNAFEQLEVALPAAARIM
jgi:quercetin dioxygenase-like cupin family protein